MDDPQIAFDIAYERLALDGMEMGAVLQAIDEVDRMPIHNQGIVGRWLRNARQETAKHRTTERQLDLER